MVVLHCSQNVSVAHRPKSGVGLGNNLTVNLAVAVEGREFSFEPYLNRIKSRLDHRCLFEDEPAFLERPSTLEAMTEFVARDLFQQPLALARWVSVEVSELDRFRCMVEPGNPDLRLKIRHRNLTLELEGPLKAATAEVACRTDAINHIDQVFAELPAIPGESERLWGERLFIVLKSRIPTLKGATVDLGRHRSIRLAQGT